MLSALQLKDEMQQGEPKYVAILLKETDVAHLTLREFVSKVLDEFVDLMLDQ